MTKRLVFLICGSAALAAIAFLVCQLTFPDVLPYASHEDAQQAWRREAAFFVTTVAWLAAVVSAASVIGLVALRLKNRGIKLR